MEEKSRETLYDKTISTLKLANREKMNDGTDRERERESARSLFKCLHKS